MSSRNVDSSMFSSTPASRAQPANMATNSSVYGPTLLRVGLGVMWVAHALLKLLVFTLPGTAQFFTSGGFPGWMACPVFIAELAGGVALLLVPVMAAAAWVHLPNGWVHTSVGGGWEYPVFLVAASVALWLIGDGAWTLRRSSRFSPSN